MQTPMRKLRLRDEDWNRLQEIAAGLVLDSQVDPSPRHDGGKLAPMLRLIARGDLVVVRPGEIEPERS